MRSFLTPVGTVTEVAAAPPGLATNSVPSLVSSIPLTLLKCSDNGSTENVVALDPPNA